MYLITNRVLKKAEGLEVFGNTPSTKGPNELRLIKVSTDGDGWRVEPVRDRLTQKRVKSLKLDQV